MFQLHPDKNFHYEAIRALALTRYYGGDLSEVLNILPNIKPGDFEDWYREWHNLALRVLSTIDESKLASYSPITLRDVYFRASRYFFVSDFFLHGNVSDPRSSDAFTLWRTYFDRANAQLPIPGVHATVSTPHGFDIPVLVYRTPQASAQNPRPTLIVGGGFDSNYEEAFHMFGVAALERGYNVVFYEGPGQPTLLHRQNKGFIHDWEKAVTPLVDWIFAQSQADMSFIDTTNLGLLGMSMGGYLAVRAAAFEPRLSAVIAIDGVWSMFECCAKVFPEFQPAWDASDATAFNTLYDSVSTASSTNKRWFHDHLKFSFRTPTGYAAYQELSKMDLTDVIDRVQVPAFIGDAESDIFFLGQPQRVADAIGEKATLVPFENRLAAGEHCQSGALVYLNQRVFEWFAEVVGDKKTV